MDLAANEVEAEARVAALAIHLKLYVSHIREFLLKHFKTMSIVISQESIILQEPIVLQETMLLKEPIILKQILVFIT